LFLSFLSSESDYSNQIDELSKTLSRLHSTKSIPASKQQEKTLNRKFIA
jgi:hypothetical protein